MSEERSQIQLKLDAQYLKDMKEILQYPAGRRLISYIIQNCGYKNSTIFGNSKDFFNGGRRSVAIEIVAACDAIGDSTNRMLGVDLRLKAEREFIAFQIGILNDILKEGVNK
jgi:hypothetical protein